MRRKPQEPEVGVLQDGDGFFRGVNMRLDPSQLQEGWVSYARNKRFEDGVLKTRKGIQKLIWTNLNDDGNPPKPQPFGIIYGAGVFQDPDSVEWILVAGVTSNGVSKVWKCAHGAGASELNLPVGTTFSGRANFVQCFNVVLLQRGTDDDTLVMETLSEGFKPIPDPVLDPSYLSGVGEVKIPNSDNAVFALNRVFIPYNRDWVFPSEIQEYTKGLAEITSFRINTGSEDELVALYKFNDTTLIAAKERSIYLIGNMAGTDEQIVANAFLDTVTTEYGCQAAKSFAQVGSDVWFLADRRGVCSIRQTEQNKLQAVDVPVSRDIDPLIRRIAWDYAHNAVAAFHDNKFYLAVPIDNPIKTARSLITAIFAYDGSGQATPISLVVGQFYYWQKGANDLTVVNGDETITETGYFKAQTTSPTLTGTPSQLGTCDVKTAFVGYNNAVLVYDTLQQAWAGYDSGDAIDVVDFIKFQYLGTTRLGFFDSFGFLNVYEESFLDHVASHNGVTWVTNQESIEDRWVSRGYLFGIPEQKWFDEAELTVATWWPEYTISTTTDGVDPVTEVKTVTKDRTKYYRPFNRADYVPTNINDDHGVPWRKDYSVDTDSDMYADSDTTENGVDPDLHQTATERIHIGGHGRYVQLIVDGSQGRSEVRAARALCRTGIRRLGTLA